MRNTFDSKNPFSKGISNPNQQSKQRQTYNSVNPKLMSFQKQAPTSNISNNEKMSKFILDTLKRLSINNQSKNVGLTTLKPNQKTLLSTIATLLNSFDNIFEEVNLNVDMLPELFRSLGYPNTINKTYFQPVGAPHTWSQCLAMMDWLAELAVFHIDIRSHLEEGCFESDFTSLLIQSYLQSNPNAPKSYLQNQINRKTSIIEDYKYSINTHNLSIQNLKAVQKDLNVMQEQQKRFESILSRQKQQVIQVNQQNVEMERRIKELQSKIEEETKMSQINEDQILSLMNQIQNQELSVEEVERIRFQIRQYHQKITELRKFNQNQKQNLDKVDSNLINEYIDFSRTLEILRHMHKKHKYEMEKRNIYLQIPECNVSDFTSFVKDRKDDCSDVKIEQMLGTKQIKEIKEKAEVLLSLVNLQLRNFQDLREQVNIQNRSLNEECLEKDLKINELEIAFDIVRTKLQSVRIQISDAQMGNKQISAQINILEEELNEVQRQQEKTITETEQLRLNTMELGQLRLQIYKEADESIQRIRQCFEEYQMQSLQVLQQDYAYFEECVQCENQYQELNQHNREQTAIQHNQNIHNSRVAVGNISNPQEKSQNPQLINFVQENSHQLEIPRSNFWNKSYNSAQEEIDNLFGSRAFTSPPNQRVNKIKQFEVNSKRQ